MKKLISASFLVVILLGPSHVAAENLPGSEWQPVTLIGESFEPLKEIFIQFDQDGRYFGHGGCNTFRGRFVTNDDAILFGPAAVTMMACPGEISEQEFAFIQALSAARLFNRDGTRLELTSSDGAALLELTQRDAD